MDNISTEILIIALVILFLLSAFFSGSETALMSINKYKMRHQAKLNNKGAKAAKKLLENPDKVIGVILLGNNLTNILITQIATLISLRLYGDIGLAIATGLLTIFILIFAELTPKTIGEMHSEKIAYSSSLLFKPMLIILYPLVFLINFIANSIIKIMGLSDNTSKSSLTSDELKTVLSEASIKFPKPHLRMLESIIDLEKATVEDIMIPRSDIYGIDIGEDIATVVNNFKSTPYTRIPVYDDNIENLLGLIHIKNIAPMLASNSIDESEIKKLIKKPYYIVSGTSLYRQLLNFQKEKRRIGFIIDEYGDIQGLVTLEDILEEIVGDFTSDPANSEEIIPTDNENIFIIDGGAHVREINQILNINLDAKNAKTINGFILEHIENLPKINDIISIQGHTFKIIENLDNAIKTVHLEINNE
ncbi:MAG: magnesium/cobalt efflux protein [Gammaproteobacteria bacterium]|nr:magnesium/cobalt efflux protein [Gammaproteobacteria bacterium]|tara:strand:- start:2272 stop:3528 length:1257 start_codon:yes stop_codon:yes gene_type:complete